MSYSHMSMLFTTLCKLKSQFFHVSIASDTHSKGHCRRANKTKPSIKGTNKVKMKMLLRDSGS